MPYAVLTVGLLIIAISIYLAAKQPPATPQVDPGELEELVVQIQLAADDAIARIQEKLDQVGDLSIEPKEAPPQLSAMAQQVQELSSQGLSHREIAAKLGRGTGAIELALGIANFMGEEKNS